jgi:twitching motility two-component system response regulator PilG
MNVYKECFEQLSQLLEDLQSQYITGSVEIEVNTNYQNKVRKRVICWYNGKIIYAGLQAPNNHILTRLLVQKFRSEWVEAAIKVITPKVTSKTSIREFLDMLVNMRVLTWSQIETEIHKQIIITIEQLLPYSGIVTIQNHDELQICRGVDWSFLQSNLVKRQEYWHSFAPIISSMEVIPKLALETLEKISDPVVANHLKQWVDGERSLVEIAEKLNQDPLQIAQSYYRWAQSGWVSFVREIPRKKHHTFKILAVDESPVVHALIQQSLGKDYQVLVATNAITALQTICREDISLLLLDLTLPDIDGLEVCRQVRNISKFRDLPIIILSSKENFLEKLKGQMAGSSYYLTKPFEPQKLKEIVSNFLPQD